MSRILWSLTVGLVLANYASAQEPGLVKEAPAGVRSVKVPQGYMVPYTIKLADGVSFEMLPIPGGTFSLGSPANEAQRNPDEGSAVTVRIEPFWMAKCEVTWAEYKLWMAYEKIFKEPDNKLAKAAGKDDADAVSAPSSLYEPTYTFEHGEDPELPAVTMSQFGARQYTKWLSQRTKQIFRLPNEAEWEYACRAGTTTAYSFGNDAGKIGEYAWTSENSDEKPHHVGKKLPNPWGLHDMHGNVMEWTLDGYDKAGYARLSNGNADGIGLTAWPEKLFPRVLRGGSFEFAANVARSAARMPSDDESWYDTDPNRPKSPWWLTDDPARSVGMRVIRPLTAPTAAELKKCWELDNPETEGGLLLRLEQGRGSRGIALPIKE